MPPRVFSGIQPTGSFHLGNYLGAIRNYVELQNRYEAIYSVVDDHALTSRPDPDELRRNTREAVKTLLACGLDPKTCIVFVQSHVPAHTELAWILSCLTAFGDLHRMTQFKEKAAQAEEKGEPVNAGIFTYPVLMAADVLLYKATLVPVGEDQVQHLELAREIVRRFRHAYGDLFPEPQAIHTPAKRILGLDGVHKMSKSRPQDMIGLLESPEEIRKKLAPAKTDEKRKRRQDPGEPNDCNIYSIHKHVTDAAGLATVETGCRTAGIGCVDCKGILAASIERIAAPIRARAAELEKNPGEVDRVIADGAARARAIAGETLDEVRRRIGLR